MVGVALGGIITLAVEDMLLFLPQGFGHHGGEKFLRLDSGTGKRGEVIPKRKERVVAKLQQPVFTQNRLSDQGVFDRSHRADTRIPARRRTKGRVSRPGVCIIRDESSPRR